MRILACLAAFDAAVANYQSVVLESLRNVADTLRAASLPIAQQQAQSIRINMVAAQAQRLVDSVALYQRGCQLRLYPILMSGDTDLHRRGFADGEPDAVGHGGVRRIRASSDPRAAEGRHRARLTARSLPGSQESAVGRSAPF